ncbi:hypothetical protein ACF1BS_15960 [Streptomyces sp. NPDC014748]|nr:hypothetical protein [Streptomyces sp. GMY02]
MGTDQGRTRHSRVGDMDVRAYAFRSEDGRGRVLLYVEEFC